ncbi:MT-A70-domain-containing protein [Podospora fimiseda]|uniref:MT-A70-domain-containing protein n=1 Tax=Podospora fimiseda TaxID=252190 RepID=A0AAN7GZP1_9PEZI|nr:MT-A70-domain-containing protein [Podospora fimiseda]
MTTAPYSSCILWQDENKTTILIDLPRSIEEAQIPSNYARGHLTPTKDTKKSAKDAGPDKPFGRRLISAVPPDVPFPTPEPKPGREPQPAAVKTSQSAQLAELMTLAAVESALEKVNDSYNGPWCLPRVTSNPIARAKKPATAPEEDHRRLDSTAGAPVAVSASGPDVTASESPSPFIPPNSHPLQGSISSLRSQFLSPSTPKFNLIILDPPWPNRSAKRKRRGEDSYSPVPTLDSIHSLLSLIPVASSLAPDGIVAVWITNTPKFYSLLTCTLFKEWDVDLIGEWVWLKVTTKGEPIVSFESEWRRPWERLVLGRKRGGVKKGAVGTKVIVGVPDLHSRKPNLRRVFEEEEGLLDKDGGYEGLEVFARNMTACWWGWGDECLKFQGREWWLEGKDAQGNKSEEDEEKQEGGGRYTT